MALNSLQEVITNILRFNALSGFNWGANGSPYYEEAPEGAVGDPSTSPHVEFEVGDSHVSANTAFAYTETCELTVRVVAVQSNVIALSSPYVGTGLFNLLDGYITEPNLLNGANFSVDDFQRKSWNIHADRDARAPNGERVWIATAVYDVTIEAAYPPKT